MTVGNHTLPADLLENCDGVIYCLADWAQNVTSGMFWVMALLGFTIVLFMGSLRFGAPRAFGFASVAGLLAAIWLAVMQLMSWTFASAFILAGVAGFAVMILQGK